MFNGNSFVELLPMKNVEHKLSVEVEFKVSVVIYDFFFFDQICTNTIFSVFSHSKYSFFFFRLSTLKEF